MQNLPNSSSSNSIHIGEELKMLQKVFTNLSKMEKLLTQKDVEPRLIYQIADAKKRIEDTINILKESSKELSNIYPPRPKKRKTY